MVIPYKGAKNAGVYKRVYRSVEENRAVVECGLGIYGRGIVI